jgi:transaldolase
MKDRQTLATEVRDFVREGFKPRFGQLAEAFPSNPLWRRLRDLGTSLWLDTGSMEDAARLWTREFTALTTNNTLLNAEIQKGQYDDLIVEADGLLASYGLTERQRILEIAFILNARHGLRLVERFDALVSVEEHTDLADDVEAAVNTARRYHAVCPERFIVKLPLTPAGLLATRRLAAEGVPVNHTLGFSARQNVMLARLAAPRYVNVFLGRLNSVVADNGLGSGANVGEKAALASQAAVLALRVGHAPAATRQIQASIRSGDQVAALAGSDVLTIPPKAAAAFLGLGLAPESLRAAAGEGQAPGIDPTVDAKALGFETLWTVGEALTACLDAAQKEPLDRFTPDDLVTFFEQHGCGDVLVRWTDAQVAASAKEGKIPSLKDRRWRGALAAGKIGLDALMNLAGLNSFRADQASMDDHVRQVLARAAPGK